MTTLVAVFHWLIVVSGWLISMLITFWAGSVSERIEASDQYREEMWWPLSRLGTKAMISGASLLSLLIVSFFMAPLFRSSWMTDDAKIVAVFCVFSGLPVLVIIVLVSLELYARHLERIGRDGDT